jgi:excisionase family DNA binding protein
VHDFLTNPAYAGAFVFGKTRQQKRLDDQGRVRVKVIELPIEQWSVCLPEHHPGYVSWDEYLATRAKLTANVRPRGQGGGAAGQGKALLQGLVRCGRCGRRMQVAYSGSDGNVPRYLCSVGHIMHHTGHTCGSLGGTRLDKAVGQAFLDAVTPAAVAATAGAIRELEDQHQARLAGQRLALERAQYEAERAERQFDACEPENRLVARTLERKLEEALAGVEREQRSLAAIERTRPLPLTDAERESLGQIARNLPRLWNAKTTTQRDRKELLRSLISEVVVTIDREQHQADVEIFWEGGANTELQIRLNRYEGPRRLPEDTIDLIRRLAAHHPDEQIAAILNLQGRRTGQGLPFTRARVQGARFRASIPAAPPPDPNSELVTIHRAAKELGVSHFTIRRWLRDGLLPGEQTTPGSPWRIRLTVEVRGRFVPDVPDGFVALAEAAKRLGVARQTVLHKVQRGELRAIQVTSGGRKGLRIEVPHKELGLFAQA